MFVNKLPTYLLLKILINSHPDSYHKSQFRSNRVYLSKQYYKAHISHLYAQADRVVSFLVPNTWTIL